MSSSRPRRRNYRNVPIVRATCATCGDVELSIQNVQVQFCMTTSIATYSFVCPVCQLIVNKDANDAVVESLTKAGARLVAWSMPAELNEPKVGPRINYDDLLEFHLALEGDSWHQELASLTPNA